MTSPSHTVRRADSGDAGAITHILATGFREDPPLAWILPEPGDRERLSPAFFKPFVDMVLTEGHAYIAQDLSGAALWLDVDVHADATEDSGDFREQFISGLGSEYAKRFFVLDDLFSANHPGHASHAYLLFIGVVPERQGQGVGNSLLAAGLGEVDRSARPAYVEASTPRNAALYARHGFELMSEPLVLPDGPSLYPMWRNPVGS